MKNKARIDFQLRSLDCIETSISILRPPSMGTPSLSIPGLGIPGLGTPGLGTPVWRPLGWRPPVLEPCSGDHQRVWGLWFGKSYASIVQAWRPLSGILVTVYKWLKSNTLSPDDDSSYYQLLERGLVNLGRVKKHYFELHKHLCNFIFSKLSRIFVFDQGDKNSLDIDSGGPKDQAQFSVWKSELIF